jgi:hypothetical protein
LRTGHDITSGGLEINSAERVEQWEIGAAKARHFGFDYAHSLVGSQSNTAITCRLSSLVLPLKHLSLPLSLTTVKRLWLASPTMFAFVSLDSRLQFQAVILLANVKDQFGLATRDKDGSHSQFELIVIDFHFIQTIAIGRCSRTSFL